MKTTPFCLGGPGYWFFHAPNAPFTSPRGFPTGRPPFPAPPPFGPSCDQSSGTAAWPLTDKSSLAERPKQWPLEPSRAQPCQSKLFKTTHLWRLTGDLTSRSWSFPSYLDPPFSYGPMLPPPLTMLQATFLQDVFLDFTASNTLRCSSLDGSKRAWRRRRCPDGSRLVQPPPSPSTIWRSGIFLDFFEWCFVLVHQGLRRGSPNSESHKEMEKKVLVHPRRRRSMHACSVLSTGRS